VREERRVRALGVSTVFWIAFRKPTITVFPLVNSELARTSLVETVAYFGALFRDVLVVPLKIFE
jgi:hypothetical protein